MGVYKTAYKLCNKDVDMYMRLRISSLFTFLQEGAIAHTEELGAGRAKTLDKGLLWVVTMQYAKIDRLPEYDETITVETWPGDTMHVLFPRYYRVLDEKGNAIINASALWILVDKNTRKMVFPDKHGVYVEGVRTGNEIALPSTAMTAQWTGQKEFCVPYSYVDLNGHMNNVRYFDLTDDSLAKIDETHYPKEIRATYSAETKYGETIDVKWGEKDGWQCLTCEDDKRRFVINERF